MKPMDNNDYRKIWEDAYDTKIPRGMHIHHINGDSSDNSLDNLAAVNVEGHARLHDQTNDPYCAQLLRERAIRGLLLEKHTTYPEGEGGMNYAKYEHIGVEILSTYRNQPRGYVDYLVQELGTGIEHQHRMYDGYLTSRGQYHPMVGQKLNIRLAYTKSKDRVFMGISNL
jgi:hypothetical protein|tara:strand:- start:395 stop:904 length:510 start_codon:yes stop_codon:yes gene_type:complete